MYLILSFIAVSLCTILFLLVSLPSRNITDIFGKTILITGGANGIGKELALQLSKKGGRIIIFDIQETHMQDIGREIIRNGGDVDCFLCDVSNNQMVQETTNFIFNGGKNFQNHVQLKEQIPFVRAKNIDILINNAGIVFGKSLLDLEEDEIKRTIDVNLMAHFWTVKAVLPKMIENKQGHIVTISSVAGLIGMNSLTDYCTSKFAAYGFGECLRRELYFHENIHTTTVCPWMVNTGMFYGAKEILLPTLQTPKVAASIINAIEQKIHVLMLPSIFHLAAVVRFIPPTVADWLGYMVGAMNATDGLIGRGKEWNMKQVPSISSKH